VQGRATDKVRHLSIPSPRRKPGPASHPALDSGFRRNDAAFAREVPAAGQPTHFFESGRDDFAVALGCRDHSAPALIAAHCAPPTVASKAICESSILSPFASETTSRFSRSSQQASADFRN
jgi:hypothetical protein